MKINIVKLQGSGIAREPLDTTLLLSIEFMLDDKHGITAIIENGKLYISSLAGKLKITPRASNAISIGVAE